MEVSDREALEEQWAKQFERTADAIAGCVDGWLKSRPHHESNLLKAAETAIVARVWAEAARALRQPRYAREEYDHREGLNKPNPLQEEEG